MQIPRVPWDCKIYMNGYGMGGIFVGSFLVCFLAVLDFTGLPLFIWGFLLETGWRLEEAME